MHELLQEVLAFFPSLEERNNAGYFAWRQYVLNLRTYAGARSLDERETLYSLANEHLREKKLDRQERIGLYFFSHVSFEIFEKFRQDDPLCRAFADHLSIVWSSISVRHGISNGRYRRLLRKQRGSEADSLASRYSALLRQDYYALKIAYKDGNHVFQLVDSAYIEKQKRAAFEAEEKKAFERAIRKARKSMYADISPDYPQLVQHQFYFDAEDVLLQLEVSGFSVAVRRPYYPIQNCTAKLTNVARRGGWPLFETVSNESDASLFLKPPTHVEAVTDEEVARQGFGEKYLIDLNELREIKNGLLPIGLKIHSMRPVPDDSLINLSGYFKVKTFERCYVVPPLGNAEMVEKVLASLGERLGSPICDSPDFQIQVCSAGRLSLKFSALLGIGFYLGADTIRRYALTDFDTTHPVTGQRLIIYDAGVLDADFPWWGRDNEGLLRIDSMQAYVAHRHRTDILGCRNMRDIRNVNLIATLLAHAQFGGYWQDLGMQFAVDMEAMLAQHHLTGLLAAGWVKGEQVPANNSDFFNFFEELMNYAFAEVARISRARERGDTKAATQGILFEMQSLLRKYGEEVLWFARQAGEVQ